MLTDKQKRVNRIGSSIMFLGRIAMWGLSVWLAYKGHWMAAVLAFLIGGGLKWKHDGKWADDGEPMPKEGSADAD